MNDVLNYLSSLFEFVCEEHFRNEGHLDQSRVEILLMHRSLTRDGGFEIFDGGRLELDPDVAIRVLLNINFVNRAKTVAGLYDLVFDINEEGRVFTQINLLDFKHIGEK